MENSANVVSAATAAEHEASANVAFAAALALTSFAFAEAPPPAGKTIPLFDGKTLEGWEGDPKLWRVEDGCLTGGSVDEMMKRLEEAKASIAATGLFSSAEAKAKLLTVYAGATDDLRARINKRGGK